MSKNIGTFAHIASLRSESPALAAEANGTLATALVFLDRLHRNGQTVWQMLPLSETHLEPGSSSTRAPSPYKGYGAGLDPKYFSPAMGIGEPSEADLAAFKEEQKSWIQDDAMHCALTAAHGTDDWRIWKPELRRRDPEAMAVWAGRNAGPIRARIVVQWKLHEAFRRLREKARRLGITLIGDMPFYIPVQSPLVWAHQELFDLNEDGSMRRVSGVPDGPQSHYGRQVWGHPLYRWENADGARHTNIYLWKIRIAHAAGLYDLIRLDHAKGLYHFGSMDSKHPEKDAYLPGPGDSALKEIVRYSRSLGLEPFAEDAGDRLAEVRGTLRKLKVPGIRMFRFAYNEKKKKFEQEYLHVDKYPRDCYAYTTTHDTVTLTGYMASMTSDERRELARRVGIPYSDDIREMAARFRRRIIDSPAGTVILPLQDWLLIDERINIPGTEQPVGDPNWRWRMGVPIEKLPETPRPAPAPKRRSSRRQKIIAAIVLLACLLGGLVYISFPFGAAATRDEAEESASEPVVLPAAIDANFFAQVDKCFLPVASLYGYALRVTSGFRTMEEQDQIYQQGRTVDGHIVTEVEAGRSLHNYGFAVDVADRWRGYDINWKRLGRIAAFCGLKQNDEGDLPHFEYRVGLTVEQFAAGLKPPTVMLPCPVMAQPDDIREPLTLDDLRDCGAPVF